MNKLISRLPITPDILPVIFSSQYPLFFVESLASVFCDVSYKEVLYAFVATKVAAFRPTIEDSNRQPV